MPCDASMCEGLRQLGSIIKGVGLQKGFIYELEVRASRFGVLLQGLGVGAL